MSALDRTNLKDKFNNASTGLFKTGQSRGIGSDDQRTQVEDVADSHFNLETDAYTGAKGIKNDINNILDLKAVATVGLSEPCYTIFRNTTDGNALRVYELVSGTDAEVSPYIIRPTDYAASTNEKVWKLADGFLKTSGTIATGAILTGNASPVEIVPAPGSGIVLVPISFFVKLDYNSAAYATNVTFFFEYGNGVQITSAIANVLDATADAYQIFTVTTPFSTSNIENQSIRFKVATGNPTAGNSPIYFTVLYAIVPTT